MTRTPPLKRGVFFIIKLNLDIHFILKNSVFFFFFFHFFLVRPMTVLTSVVQNVVDVKPDIVHIPLIYGQKTRSRIVSCPDLEGP